MPKTRDEGLIAPLGRPIGCLLPRRLSRNNKKKNQVDKRGGASKKKAKQTFKNN